MKDGYNPRLPERLTWLSTHSMPTVVKMQKKQINCTDKHTHKRNHQNNLGTQTKNMHSIFPIQVDMSAQNQNLHNFKQDTEMMPQMHYKHC